MWAMLQRKPSRAAAVFLVIAAACSLGMASEAAATTCVEFRPSMDRILQKGFPERYDDYYSHVFVGTVRDIQPAVMSDLGLGGNSTVYMPVIFDVEAALFGDVDRQAVVMNNGGRFPGSSVVVENSSTFDFEEGERYLVVAGQNPDGTFHTDICTRTRRITAEGAARLVELAPNPSVYRGEDGGAPTSAPTAGSTPETDTPMPSDDYGPVDLANSRPREASDPPRGASTTSIVLAAIAGAVFSSALMLIRRRRRFESERETRRDSDRPSP